MSCSILNILANANISSTIEVNVLQALGSPSLQCVLGSRMFFNLKEAGNNPTNDSSRFTTSFTAGGLAFGPSETLVADADTSIDASTPSSSQFGSSTAQSSSVQDSTRGPTPMYIEMDYLAVPQNDSNENLKR